jgi:hypothetical protein
MEHASKRTQLFDLEDFDKNRKFEKSKCERCGKREHNDNNSELCCVAPPLHTSIPLRLLLDSPSNLTLGTIDYYETITRRMGDDRWCHKQQLENSERRRWKASKSHIGGTLAKQYL